MNSHNKGAVSGHKNFLMYLTAVFMMDMEKVIMHFHGHAELLFNFIEEWNFKDWECLCQCWWWCKLQVKLESCHGLPPRIGVCISDTAFVLVHRVMRKSMMSLLISSKLPLFWSIRLFWTPFEPGLVVKGQMTTGKNLFKVWKRKFNFCWRSIDHIRSWQLPHLLAYKS